MADWTPVIETKVNDHVDTPQGQGRVVRVSEAQKTAQVDVRGQLFEVPLGDVKPIGGGSPDKPEGATPMPDTPARPLKPWTAKPGKRVQTKDGAMKGEIKNVTQRSVEVEFDNGVKQKFEKRRVASALDEETKGTPPRLGDRVEVTDEGSVYTSFKDEAKRLDADNWKEGNRGDKGEQGTLVNSSTRGIALVQKDDGTQFMIGEEGIKKVGDAKKEEPKKEEKTQAPESTKDVKDTVKQTGDGLHELLQLKKYLESKIDEDVSDELKELRELIKQKQQLEVKVGDKVNTVPGLKHKQLEQLIKYCALRLSPLMVGMAGTGKTHAGEQTASALGLDFYAMSVGAQTSKSDIIGYMAANGQYVTTHFRKAYEEGGVFLMDEIDAGNANVLIQINAALSNGLCAFPDAMVKRHEDFVFIASANTFGNGANRQYVGRNQLDAATLDRFAVIEWFIDDELESQLTTGLNGKAWYMAVRAARDYVADKKIRALVSPRATQKGSRLLDVGQDLDEVINATLLSSVPEDKKADVRDVAVTIFNKFASEVPGKLSKQVNPNVSDLFKEDKEIDLSNIPF